ncbi:NAD-dependent protein deacylase [Ihubacter massiliensis]|uniref:NAD-dependent protein deacetylase n=1 Tax=Hominibacterium faecale TaxID=2839743 RepID=A0A9J6QQZ6_9FIRM|nr:MULTISPECIES: NAD-dependent protein deacylase [Eubacteriales Family XIII. Incertae Sedis]MCI7301673.1 NAD-dependent protein deacylase [Clostridia bacterium]MDE8731879.1 NAD-dependent protein deacylase [Eubacteriales bacterium DFI.9.88]MDY3013319.1 NAD-dependent protein deacylase [Clostridiales Family XIII bacterium]MCO7122609.1 NAD-dependent protein deacylase [Ihubacter massiliensis]MCU7376883.1 NAD-dependent protein deacylase [Hominibacterium faecale]
MDARVKDIVERSQHIVFFGGAGVSTESNIPDFRSESGLYSAVSQYGQSPETMLSHTFFRNSMETFFDYYKNNLIYRDAKPNKAHIALSRLEEEGKLNAVVTQNIDGLHQMAGSKQVYELHGSVLRNYCVDCGAFYDLDYIMDEAHCDGLIPKCEKCGGVVKPDVVLYEEALDEQVISGAVAAIRRADTLIVGGTSLVVYPAAGLINYFGGKNLILINKSETQYDSRASLVINDSIGAVLGD